MIINSETNSSSNTPDVDLIKEVFNETATNVSSSTLFTAEVASNTLHAFSTIDTTSQPNPQVNKNQTNQQFNRTQKQPFNTNNQNRSYQTYLTPHSSLPYASNNYNNKNQFYPNLGIAIPSQFFNYMQTYNTNLSSTGPTQYNGSFFFDIKSYANNSKSHLFNYRNEFLNVRRAQNLNRLWPHNEKNNNYKNKSLHKTSQSEIKENKNDKPGDTLNPEATDEKQEQDISKKRSELLNSEQLEEKAMYEETGNQANPNTKTGMCLINELVKFNKIKHEYTLLDEIGPAHKKTFYVQLTLGVGIEVEEKYVGNGTSIKKAQQIVADMAYKATKFKKPTERNSDKENSKNKSSNTSDSKVNNNGDQSKSNKQHQTNLVPTVMLNALAMKLDLKPVYTQINNSASYSINARSNTYQHSSRKMFQNNYTNFMNNDFKPFVYQPANPSYQYSNSYIPVSSYHNGVISWDRQPPPLPPQTPHQPFNNKILNKIQKFSGDFNNNSIGGGGDQYPKFLVKLKFAEQEFEGEGLTPQAAKHNAAQKALAHFSQIENYNQAKQLVEQKKKQDEESKAATAAAMLVKTDSSKEKPENEDVKKQDTSEVTDNVVKAIESSADQVADNISSSESKQPSIKILARKPTTASTVKAVELKASQSSTMPKDKATEKANAQGVSEINVLNYCVNILKKIVKYELIQESGPSHAKKFVTRCSVEPNPKKDELFASSNSSVTKANSHFEVTGEGHSKKVSKLNAAIKMLKIINENFEPIILMHVPQSRVTRANRDFSNTKNKSQSEKKEKIQQPCTSAAAADANKKRNKSTKIDKIKKTTPEYGKGTINPISRLIQIQQAKKEPEPEFELASTATIKHRRYHGGTGDKFLRVHRQEFIYQCIVKFKITATYKSETLNSIEIVDAAVSNDWEAIKCEGRASTKKNAKRNAAEAMLVRLGYQLQPILKPALKNNTQIIPVASTEQKEKTCGPDKNVKIEEEEKSSSSSDSSSPLAGEKSSEKRVSFDKGCLENELTEKKQNVKFTSQLSSPLAGEKLSEKRVTFDEECLENELTEKKQNIKPTPKNSSSALSKTNLSTNLNANKHQRINYFKEKLYDLNMSRENSNDMTLFKDKELKQAYKIATELLESTEKQAKKSTAADYNSSIRENNIKKLEFYSETAEKLLKGQASSEETSITWDKTSDESLIEPDSLSISMLTGKTVNYKKILDYLAEVMKFKVNYQSLLLRDGGVNSYVSLTLLPKNEKPIVGQGATHLESSNVAALSALKYLSSKHTKS